MSAEFSIRQPSAIVCFFLICAETIMIKKGKSGGPLCDISYIILKRWDDTNQEGNSITNEHVTRGP
jgi:hypothetical protein